MEDRVMPGEVHRPWERQQIDTAISKIADLGEWCRAMATRHRGRARFWGGLHVALGLPAAVLAAIAGVAALGNFSRVASGVVALTAAGLSAASTYLDAATRQAAAQQMADSYATLGVEATNYVTVDGISPYRKLDAPYLFKDFNERLTAVRAGQPLPEMWWKGQPAHAYSSADDVDWLE